MATEEPGLKREIVTLVEDTAKELSGVLDACMKEDILTRFENSLRLLSQNRGVSDVRVARDKLIVILETLEFFREAVGPNEQLDLMQVCRMCFRELSVSMAILEKAFASSLEGNLLQKVMKELILKLDNALLEIKRKSIDLVSFGSEEIKREVNAFFGEYIHDDSEDKFGGDLGGQEGLQKKLIEMQMQVMSKNQIIENYAEEIERLNNRMRQIGAGDGANFDINAIYSDIENLNSTIEHLKKENQKLRQSLNAFNGNAENDLREGGPGEAKADVDNLVDKLNSLEKRIRAGPSDGLDIKQSKQAQRVAELENQQYQLTRQLVEFEETTKTHKREVESLQNEKTKLKDCLDRLHADHEALKAKSLDLLKRNGHIENENESLRKEKTQLVDSILALQKSHSDELNSLRSTLESLGEKLYVVGLDTENKQTFTDLDNRHSQDKRAWTEKNRILQETCEQLQRDNQTMETKIEEQHNVINMYARVEATLLEEQRKLRKLEGEFDRLQENYSALEGEREEALGRIRGLEKDVHQAKEDKLKAHQEINELNRHKGDLHRNKADLEDRVKSLEGEAEELKEKLNTVEGDKRTHERTINQFKNDSLRTNDILKLSKEEITNLQEAISEKRREMESLEKDRNFLKKKVERLEDQLFQKEKKFLREEAEREVDSEERLRRLIEENESLKEELIILERANCKLFNDVEFYKTSPSSGTGTDKLRAENERLRDMFRRSEMNWHKERQALLGEIDALRDDRTDGYRSQRPERDFGALEGKDNKFMSTYASVGSRTSPSPQPRLHDSALTRSKKTLP